MTIRVIITWQPRNNHNENGFFFIVNFVEGKKSNREYEQENKKKGIDGKQKKN